MVCSICFECDHNKRTCPFQLKAPVGVDLSESPLTSERDIPTKSEKRIAKQLAALLPPPNKSKKVSKPLVNLSDCQNIWKEPKDFYAKKKTRENTCSHCGGKGHNSRSCLMSPPTVILPYTALPEKKQKQCGVCGGFGHNSRTCIKLPEKKQKQCGVCGGFGHNARTCMLKCQPCSL